MERIMKKMRSYQAFKKIQRQAKTQFTQKPSQKEVDCIIKKIRKSYKT